MAPSMTYQSIDDLLDQLLTFSETLAEAAPAGASDTFQAVLNERASLVHRLVEAGKTTPLSTAQSARLRRAVELGEQARFSVAAKRENLRARVLDVRRSRQSRQALKPFRPTTGRRLNLEG